LRPLKTWSLSCSAAEELLRDVAEHQRLASTALVAAHLENCRGAQRALLNAGVEHECISLLLSALRALEAAELTLDAYQFSTDPEISHIPMLRSEALQMLDVARTQTRAALQVLPEAV
jgi:hypothetical protein